MPRHRLHIPLLTLLLIILISTSFSQTPQNQPRSPGIPATAISSLPIALQSQLTKIGDTIVAGNIAAVSTAVGLVANSPNYGCKEKSIFVGRAMELLRNRQVSIQEYARLYQTGQIPISKTDAQLKTMLTSLKKNLSQKNYTNDIKLLQSENKNFQQNIQKYTASSTEDLNKIKQLQKITSPFLTTSKEENAIIKLEGQLGNLDKLINETSRKRAELHKNMTAIKISLLNMEIKAREGTSQKKHQEQFRQYSQLAIQASQKLSDKQQQIKKLKTQQSIKQQTPTSVDDEIEKIVKQLEQKKGLNNERAIEAINGANQILSQNLKNIQIKISILGSQCLM